jgi:hypothetical protein
LLQAVKNATKANSKSIKKQNLLVLNIFYPEKGTVLVAVQLNQLLSAVLIKRIAMGMRLLIPLQEMPEDK